jgi:hypothetical protein
MAKKRGSQTRTQQQLGAACDPEFFGGFQFKSKRKKIKVGQSKTMCVLPPAFDRMCGYILPPVTCVRAQVSGSTARLCA